MPPSVPPTPLEKSETLLRNPADEEGEPIVASFFDLEGAGLAIKARRFDQEELFDRVIGHIRSDNEKVSLGGINQFWKMSKDLVTMNGRLVRHSEHLEGTPDGTSVSASIHSHRLLASLQSRRHRPPEPRALPLSIPPITFQPPSRGEPIPIRGDGGGGVIENHGEAVLVDRSGTQSDRSDSEGSLPTGGGHPGLGTIESAGSRLPNVVQDVRPESETTNESGHSEFGAVNAGAARPPLADDPPDVPH